MVAAGNVSLLKLAGFVCDKFFITALCTLCLMNNLARGAAIRSTSEPKLQHTCPLHWEVDFHQHSCKCDDAKFQDNNWQTYLAEILSNDENDCELSEEIYGLPVANMSIDTLIATLESLLPNRPGSDYFSCSMCDKFLSEISALRERSHTVFQNICQVNLPQGYILNNTVFREVTTSVANKLLEKLKTECDVTIDPIC